MLLVEGRAAQCRSSKASCELETALARKERNKVHREQRRKEHLMRKVIASPFVTLDGFMAGPQGEIDWNEPYFDEEMARYVGEQFAALDTLLFGRGTYQLFVQYWPTQGVKDDPIFAEKMNTLPKLVFSRTLENVTWNNTRLVRENIAGEIQALKRQAGKHIVIDGSPGLIHSLTRLGLIDE